MKKLLFALCLVSCALHAQQKKAEGPVYIIHSDKGSFNPTGDGTQGMLMLDELDQTVPYVYSHPMRKVGAERLSEFLRIWTAGGKLQYDSDPPNAHLLIYDRATQSYENILVELLHIEVDNNMSDLSFEVRSLTGKKFKKENLGEVTLFIDCFPFCL